MLPGSGPASLQKVGLYFQCVTCAILHPVGIEARWSAGGISLLVLERLSHRTINAGEPDVELKSRTFVALLCLLIGFSAVTAHGQDIRALERQANSELRNAQSLMFSGKLDESLAALDMVETLLSAIREQDASSTQVPSLEQRLQRQRTDLERRLPAAPTPQPETRPGPGVFAADTLAPPRPLPRNTRQEMQRLNSALQSLETTEKGRLERTLEGDSHHMQQMETTLKRIREKLDELPGLFAQVMAAATTDGVADHPELAAALNRMESITTWTEETMVAARAFVENAAAIRAEVAKDAEVLAALFDEYRVAHFDPIGNLAHAYTTEDIHRAFTLLAEYVAVKGQLEETVTAYEEKYGRSREEIERSTGGMANVYPWQNFRERMRNMEEVPVLLAAKIKENMESELAGLERRHDFYRLQGHESLRTLAGFQRQYAPDAPAVDNLEERLAADLDQYHARIKQRTWPASKGTATDRDGALEYFWATWGRDAQRQYTVLDTVITGDWSVQKRDLTGRPTMYGLPVLLAVQTPEDKANGLARVFILTARTAESAQARMEPPFTSDTVGDSYFIREAAIR